MKKIALFLVAVALAAVSCCNDSTVYPTTFAHRGCWISGYVPENSLEGVKTAARYGYPTLECDVKFTSDSVLVLMHDGTINRTMRNAADYSVIEEKVKVKETDFATLRENYVFESDSLNCRQPIPTFAEFMDACEEYGIVPILHCDIYEGYVAAQERLGSRWIAFTEDYELCRKVRKLNQEVLIFYSPKKQFYDRSAEGLIADLDSIGGWCGISSMHYPLMRKSVCDSLKAAGYTTQSSIFPVPHEMEAISNGAEIILSDFCWFPTEGMKADKTYSFKNKESVCENFPAVEFACMTVKLNCTGHYVLTVNGMEKSYDIDNDGGQILLGYRLFNTVPSVELKPADDCTDGRVRKLEVSIYQR